MGRGSTYTVRIIALLTIITVTHCWSKAHKYITQHSQGFEFQLVFKCSWEDFTTCVLHALICAITALYSAGEIDQPPASRTPRCITAPDNNESGRILPFSRAVLQVCRLWGIVNQFYYPNLAIAFITIYLRYPENYSSYCLALNALWLLLYAIKACIFMQEYAMSTLPDDIMRYALASVQIVLGITHDNLWISLGGIFIMFAVALSPAYSFTRSMPFVEFREFLVCLTLAANCHSLGFARMVSQMEFDQIYADARG